MSTNQYLATVAGNLNLIDRLQQMFVDAAELMGDVASALPRAVTDLEDADGTIRADIEETIAVLHMARTKVHNVVYDFNVHFLHGTSDKDGIQQLLIAAELFKPTDSQ